MKKEQTFSEKLKTMSNEELKNFNNSFLKNNGMQRRSGKTQMILNAQTEILSEMERRSL